MNELSSIEETSTRPATAFPTVFLSYDEPWADTSFAELRRIVPGAVRVHGVQGLDACHKAAAEAVPGDWVITVDADTRLLSGFSTIRVPEALLTGDYRLDWPARNAMNGLWSGNGCVKLWPKQLLRAMRTHEAAPEDSLSLDHDMAKVIPGVTGQVTLPDRVAETDPGRTAEHAFRAGLREAVFLRRLAAEQEAREGLPDWTASECGRLLRVWASVGRHTPFGIWAIYGARLGLILPEILPDWDPRSVNDYGWLARFWAERVRPRFRGGSGWRWTWLEEDAAVLGLRLGMPELDAAASQRLSEAERLSPGGAANRLDSVGYRLTRGTPRPAVVACARTFLETAAALDHPAAFLNLGLLHARGLLPDADPAEAAWLLRAAAALGNPYAPERLAALHETQPQLRAAEAERPARTVTALEESPLELRLDPGFVLAPEAARHVPDPAEFPEGRIVGYLSRSEVTGRALPLGVRIARRGAPDGPPDRHGPAVLGLWTAPVTPEAALADGARAFAAGAAEPGWATLGRDAPFGDYFVIGLLAAALGTAPGAALEDEPARADLIRLLAARYGSKTGMSVPVWTAEESAATKVLLRPMAERHHWEAAGGAQFRHVAEAVWGRRPSAISR